MLDTAEREIKEKYREEKYGGRERERERKWRNKERGEIRREEK